MKKNLLTACMLVCIATMNAQNEPFLLDLSDNDITYNENNVWDGIYGNDSFEADGYIFSHTAPYGPGYYEGFLPSRNTDNANHYDAAGWTANQWGCMAQGGVDMSSEDLFRADAIIGKPFMINYFSAYSLTPDSYGTSYITMSNNSTFVPQGIYVCNSPWGYYGTTEGDGFARPLTNEGDYYKITFNGVNIKQGTTHSIDFYLAEYLREDRNKDGIINSDDNYTNDHWAWCDLHEMGDVDVIYITMDSSDQGEFGMNTSTIVCLDGLSCYIRGSVNDTPDNNNNIFAANGMIYTSFDKEQTITLYNTAGMAISTYRVAAGTHIIDTHNIASGIYFVQHSYGVAKIIL